ncbi:MAG: hypothetical protein GX601_18455, partial [Anaerolineales bacterium]|nr:hypothetical protein [Anaerolineales bacterium]
ALLDVWRWAARCLLNRARTSELLLSQTAAVLAGRPLVGQEAEHAQALLAEQRALRAETDVLYATMIRPIRKGEMVAYMFEPVERALAGLAQSEGATGSARGSRERSLE